MYPKSFFEQFWRGSDIKNQLFVGMPFDIALDNKWELIQKAANETAFDNALRVDENLSADTFQEKIWDGIAHSSLLLFDISDDPKLLKYTSSKKDVCLANQNVLYELGIAMTVREPTEILIIREASESKVPSNISTNSCISYRKEDLTVEWLADYLKNKNESIDWNSKRLVKHTTKLLDADSLALINQFGDLPGEGNFAGVNLPVSRLLELGLLYTTTCQKEQGKLEFSYRWTGFGKKVIECISTNKS